MSENNSAEAPSIPDNSTVVHDDNSDSSISIQLSEDEEVQIPRETIPIPLNETNIISGNNSEDDDEKVEETIKFRNTELEPVVLDPVKSRDQLLAETYLTPPPKQSRTCRIL